MSFLSNDKSESGMGIPVPAELVNRHKELEYIVISYFCKLCKWLVLTSTHLLVCTIDVCYHL